MVLSAMVIQSTRCEPIPKTASLSLVAFERLIKADLGGARRLSKLLVQMRYCGRTKELTSNAEGFKSETTPPPTPLSTKHPPRGTTSK